MHVRSLSHCHYLLWQLNRKNIVNVSISNTCVFHAVNKAYAKLSIVAEDAVSRRCENTVRSEVCHYDSGQLCSCEIYIQNTTFKCNDYNEYHWDMSSIPTDISTAFISYSPNDSFTPFSATTYTESWSSFISYSLTESSSAFSDYTWYTSDISTPFNAYTSNDTLTPFKSLQSLNKKTSAVYTQFIPVAFSAYKENDAWTEIFF